MLWFWYLWVCFFGGLFLKELDLLIVVYISRQLFSILELYFPQIFDSILPPSSSQVFDFEKIAEYSHSVSTVLYLLSFWCNFWQIFWQEAICFFPQDFLLWHKMDRFQLNNSSCPGRGQSKHGPKNSFSIFKGWMFCGGHWDSHGAKLSVQWDWEW